MKEVVKSINEIRVGDRMNAKGRYNWKGVGVVQEVDVEKRIVYFEGDAIPARGDSFTVLEEDLICYYCGAEVDKELWRTSKGQPVGICDKCEPRATREGKI